MYAELKTFFERPAPFSVYTVDSLWTDPHRAGQMLACHLDQDNELASRRNDQIGAIVSWLDDRLGFAGKAVTDLGCGPGLYAEEITRRGGTVTGLDFSENSLAHARKHAETEHLAITYRQADYLKDPLPTDQDVFMLIYGDLCPLSPENRHLLMQKIRKSLKPGGVFICDIFAPVGFDRRTENQGIEHHPDGGFWAPGDHFVLNASFLYPDMKLGLDRYRVVTAKDNHEVYNWMQYFDPDAIASEIREAGFAEVSAFDLYDGGAVNPEDDVYMVISRT